MSQSKTSRRNFLRHAAAATVAAPLAVTTEAAGGEEYAVARRCHEIYSAQVARQRADAGLADGTYYFAQHFDAITDASQNLILDPGDEFFLPVFTASVRDLGYDDARYVRLKELIAEVDAGADLSAMAEEQGRRAEERMRRCRESKPAPDPFTLTAARLAELLEAPETPPVLVSLLTYVCLALDGYSVAGSGPGGDIGLDDYQWTADDGPTPESVRRELPKMLREIRNWRVEDGIPYMVSGDGEGGE